MIVFEVLLMTYLLGFQCDSVNPWVFKLSFFCFSELFTDINHKLPCFFPLMTAPTCVSGPIVFNIYPPPEPPKEKPKPPPPPPPPKVIEVIETKSLVQGAPTWNSPRKITNTGTPVNTDRCIIL
ncbi:hypothetical protein J3Q64DRAFT_1695528 [Phycomyces blakesleeanus]|uniref:Uncharacterized protein n=2 Tax=Phycomyces blakesleeanus TaxID=4837 RepID=A0A162PW20_PHYB8|nr:hypothetical protein PHYBLDRAFT_63253 [Phycomyces blakesleeanus NRRL 1555(-)]OAD76537.1 hypothetical protein PHYBLDRAFT_63253 [Phycomyces blakesleeanus NRRL 1555(-)]|eukprot:XP_018294577.1 hypothetical protein PHYBLDRAFT_63253 [Phycomyces blakesleeanus NRRL 1555(-)]